MTRHVEERDARFAADLAEWLNFHEFAETDSRPHEIRFHNEGEEIGFGVAREGNETYGYGPRYNVVYFDV